MMNETLHYLKGLVRPFSREYRRNCRQYPKARPISYEAWLEIKRNHWATFFHADDGRELPGQDRAAYCKVRAGAYVRMTDKGLTALVEEFDRRLALSILDQALAPAIGDSPALRPAMRRKLKYEQQRQEALERQAMAAQQAVPPQEAQGEMA